jgi:hypothetical protein
MDTIRRVAIPAHSTSPEAVISVYTDATTGAPTPNTEIVDGDAVVLRINALGCKGEDLSSNLPAVAFVGDRTVFGSITSSDSWVHRVVLPGFQILNVGVPTDDPSVAWSLLSALRNRIPLAAVVLYHGWNGAVYNVTGASEWRALYGPLVAEYPVIFTTLLSGLGEVCRWNGLAPMTGIDPTAFLGRPGLGAEIHDVRRALDCIKHYNQFVAAFAAEHGRPLLDLHSLFVPTDLREVGRDFETAWQPKEAIFPRMGEMITTQLVPLLAADRGGSWMNKIRVLGKLLAPKSKTEEAKAPSPHIYPLW